LSHVPKTYVVKVAGTPDESGLEKLRRGLIISEGRFSAARAQGSGHESSRGAPLLPGFSRSANKKRSRVKTAPAKIRLIRESENPWYEVTLIEGKNRQIRRMFEEIGHHVEKIKRVRYGPLSLDVPPGEFRRLSMGEIEKLKSAAGLGRGPKSR
jgi:23S rRNA pseudouridine2605 synthase